MADNNWLAVFRNFSWARAVWKRMTIILSREGTEPQMSIFFFKSVVQVVLLFGSETWVVTPSMGSNLGGFQGQVAPWLTGWLLRRKIDRKWDYTSSATAKEEAGSQTIKEYMRRQQNMVAQYIATQSLLDLCEVSERAPGAQVGMWWWEKVGINLAGKRKATSVSVEAEENRGTEWRRG